MRSAFDGKQTGDAAVKVQRLQRGQASRTFSLSALGLLYSLPFHPSQLETSRPLSSRAEDECGSGYCTFLAGRSDPAVQAAAAAAAWLALRPVLALAGLVAVRPVAVHAAV